MKKLLLVVALAVVLVGLLATTAFAQPPLQDGVYIWIYDGSWFQVTGGQLGDTQFYPTPIPADQPYWLFTAWGGYGRGRIQSVANAIVETLSLNGTPVVSTAAESKALWTMPSPSALLGEFTPFNPRMRIGGWVAAWLYPITTLAPGTYEVTGAETYTHPITDLAFLAENHPGPYIFPAGTTPFGPWALVLP
jgi:hypothetical protein